MVNNILVADDSLTIQKVVAITLASQSYNIKKCLNEEELIKQLELGDNNLLLLDFNLSTTKNGYDLAKEILKISPSLPIMAMMGTFDTIDENLLLEAGILDKVVKPFESEKFINKCKALIESKSKEDITLDEEVRAKEQDEELFGESDTDELTDGWRVDSSAVSIPDEVNDKDYERPVASTSQTSVEANILESELMGWGIEVPPVIGGPTEELSLMPPVIENAGPMLEAPRSKLVSMSELACEDGDLEENTPKNHGLTVDSKGRNLSDELNEGLSGDDFWEVDDQGVGQTVKKEELSEFDDDVEIKSIPTDDFKESEIKERNVEDDQVLQVEKFADHGETSNKEERKKASEGLLEISEDELVEKLKASLTPVIRELIQDFCREKVEQVAWEIIPDLAENIIKKEVKEIADDVKNTTV